jgi:uncharacterized protein (TIGR00369 family)
MAVLDDLTAQFAPLFPGLMGLKLTKADPDLIEGTVEVRPDLCTTGHIMHGGAIMAVADTIGAVGTFVNLRAGQGTTTLESKTNFFAAAREGVTVTATCRPLHRGRRTMVWQTTLTLPDGKMVAMVTQTQMVLEG